MKFMISIYFEKEKTSCQHYLSVQDITLVLNTNEGDIEAAQLEAIRYAKTNFSWLTVSRISVSKWS